MSKVRLTALALGLSLGLGGSAQAAPRCKPAGGKSRAAAKADEAQRAMLRRLVEVGGILAKPTDGRPHLDLIYLHHHNLREGSPIIATNESESLVLSELDFRDRVLFVHDKAGSRKATPADLSRFGIHDAASLDRVVAQRMLALTGTTDLQRAAEVLQQQIDAGAVLVDVFTKSADLQLLKEHHDVVRRPKAIDSGRLTLSPPDRAPVLSFWQESSGRGDTLYAHVESRLVPPRAEHLLSLGMSSVAAVQQHLAQLVLDHAGYSAAATDARAVEKARAELRAQIADTKKLAAFVTDPDSHPDFALVRQAHRAMSPGKLPHLTLSTMGSESIVLNTSHSDSSLLLVNAGTKSAAKLADLHRLKLGTTAELDAALREQLYSIAAEDWQ